VCVCMIPCRYTEFTCGYLCISVYSHRVYFCIYVITYIHTGFPCVCVCIHVHVRGVRIFGVYICACMSTEFGWVCMWLRIYTQRLYVFVFIYVCTYTEECVLCIFAYMWTGFTWMCVHTMIVSACTHVKGMV